MPFGWWTGVEHFLVIVLWVTEVKTVFRSINHTEMEMLKSHWNGPDYRMWNNTTVWSGWVVKEWNMKMAWHYLFNAVHHFEEPRQNMFSVIKEQWHRNECRFHTLKTFDACCSSDLGRKFGCCSSWWINVQSRSPFHNTRDWEHSLFCRLAVLFQSKKNHWCVQCVRQITCI